MKSPANAEQDAEFRVEDFVPEELQDLGDPQKAIPAIAKDKRKLALIQEAVQEVPTHHALRTGDARTIQLAPASIHLVVTSPPYWTLKEYRDTDGQLGHVVEYETFLQELDKVWRRCFDALVPGGASRVRRRRCVSLQTEKQRKARRRSASRFHPRALPSHWLR